MKLAKIFLPLTAIAVSSLGLTGCNNKGTRVGGSAVIQIKSYKGGYGTDWLHEMARQFKTIYPEISFEFVEESSQVVFENVGKELVVPKNNQIDLYFLNGSDVDFLIQKSYSVLKKRDVVILEPLDDVFESKGIGLSGQESQTIQSRFFEGFENACRYNGSFERWRGNLYILPWANASTGVFMNKSVLDRYNIEVPLTSNEFKTAVETIYNEGRRDSIFPWSWAGSNAVGYWEYLYETWFAQYSGTANFENFMNCNPGDGNIKEEGYKVFEDQGILKALEAMYEILDLRYSANGSASKTHMEAQSEFVRGKSAFMCDGDWLLNEMKKDYFDKAKDIQMLGVPVLSCIGEEIGITDSQLHTLVEMIDEHKTNSEIKSIITSLIDSQIARVREARSIHDTIGTGHSVMIPSYSDAKEAAKLFLRFVYSNDGCRIFRNFAYSNLPLSYTTQEGDTNTPFQQSLDKINDYDTPRIITSAAHYNCVRDIAQLYLFNSPAWIHPTTFRDIMIDKNSSSSVLSPNYIFTAEQRYVRNNWSRYMSNINYL